MKSRFYSILLTLFAVVALSVAAQAKDKEVSPIKFEKTDHNFGKIEESKGPVTAVFPFTNVSNENVVIVSVTNGGCGCTRPQFPAQPIKPGEKGEIKITFDPKGRNGGLNRKVLVKVSGMKNRIGLTFKGNVKSKK